MANEFSPRKLLKINQVRKGEEVGRLELEIMMVFSKIALSDFEN